MSWSQWCGTTVNSSRAHAVPMFMFMFIFLNFILLPRSYRLVHARRITFTLLEVLPLSSFSPLSFPCLVSSRVLTNTHPPLSFTNRWNMVDDLQDPHCIVWVTWQSYWWWRSKHRRVEYREWEWDVGALTTTTKAATVVLGLVGVGMAVLGVFVR